MDLRGKGVLITGASRGLGRALATRLAHAGAKLALVARSEHELAKLVTSLREQGSEAYALAYDIADKDAIYKLVGQAQELAGPIDVVVHCASSLGPLPLVPFLETDCEDFESALQTNVLGPFRLSKALAGSMELRKTGLLVFISSDAAVDAYPSWGAYGASKAAADHMARTLANELTHARVLIIDPGEMNTKMHADAMPDIDPNTLTDPDEVARTLVRLIEQSETHASGKRLQAQGATP